MTWGADRSDQGESLDEGEYTEGLIALALRPAS